MRKVTVIGGGTGAFVVLTGLKEYPLDLGVVVTMMDSGGSTGRLRDQLGVLPPGDLRQCLVALSEAPGLWRQLFLYRFKNGDLKGHNFGNIFLSALEKVCSNYDEVIDTVSYVLKTKGKVIPVTYEKTHLCVRYKNGKILKGEGNIEENVKEKSAIEIAFLETEVKINPKVIKRIQESEYLIIGPGDLYTSIIPVFLVKGIVKAIKKNNPKIIFIMNLMTKSGQTTNYKALDHINDVYKYLHEYPDIIVINKNSIPQDVKKWYLLHNEKEVIDNLENSNLGCKVISYDLVNKEPIVATEADNLTRSILRHDSKKLAKVIYKIINQEDLI